MIDDLLKVHTNPMTGSRIGVTTCTGGWLAVEFVESEWGVQLYPSAFSLWFNHQDAERILIDLPIGLPETPDQEPRQCDIEARQKLSPYQQQSILQVPTRQAVQEETYTRASATNEQIVGKKLNTFSWGLCPLIREIDELLSFDPTAKSRIRETHPEICFWSFNDFDPLVTRKSTADGIRERKTLLERINPSSTAVLDHIQATYESRAVQLHDGLYALATAITAAAEPSQLRTLPKAPNTDSKGLPMEIVYATDWHVTQSTVTDFT